MTNIFLMPEYMHHFSCIGSACEDTCCSGWIVTIDKNTYQKYKKAKAPNLKEMLRENISRERSNPSNENYAKFKMNEKGNCTFLTEDGWCKIHSELGEDYLCNTCKVYPRVIKKVEQFIEVSLTPSCPEASRKILLNKQGIDFVLEDNFLLKSPVQYNVNLSEKQLFDDIRYFTISILQNRSQKLEVRLMVLGLFINKINTLDIPQQLEVLEELMAQYSAILNDKTQVQELLELPSNLSFQINIVRDLLNYRFSSSRISSTRYTECLEEVIEGLLFKESGNIEKSLEQYSKNIILYNEFMNENEYILENYLVNAVFKDLFPNNYDTYFESYVMLIVNFCMIKLHLIGMCSSNRELTEELVIKLIHSYSKEIEHNKQYLINVRKMLKDSGYTTMAHMVVLLKS